MKPYRKRSEVNRLIEQWEADPCWDIWQTEGFEAHEAELRQFQAEVEREWAQKHRARVQHLADELHCSRELAWHLMRLERRVDNIDRAICS